MLFFCIFIVVFVIDNDREMIKLHSERTNKQTNKPNKADASHAAILCTMRHWMFFCPHISRCIHNTQSGHVLSARVLNEMTLHGEISEFWFVYLMRSWGLRKCTWEWTRVTEQSGFHCMCQVQAKLAGFELACEVREQCGSVYFWERSNWWGWARRQITGSHVAMCVCECVWVCSMCTLHVRV